MNEHVVDLTKQGLRIRRARRFKLMTQGQLAEKLSAELGEYFGDENKVSRIEKGRQDVTSRELSACSLVLEQPVIWLQGISEDGFDSNGAKGVYLRSHPALLAA